MLRARCALRVLRLAHVQKPHAHSVEGGELFDRVIDDDFVLTERACAVFVRQVCQAMEFVHRNNIIHLDLKPENILCLTREGNRIKIIDFGLARRFDPDKKLQVGLPLPRTKLSLTAYG